MACPKTVVQFHLRIPSSPGRFPCGAQSGVFLPSRRVLLEVGGPSDCLTAARALRSAELAHPVGVVATRACAGRLVQSPARRTPSRPRAPGPLQSSLPRDLMNLSPSLDYVLYVSVGWRLPVFRSHAIHVAASRSLVWTPIDGTLADYSPVLVFALDQLASGQPPCAKSA